LRTLGEKLLNLKGGEGWGEENRGKRVFLPGGRNHLSGCSCGTLTERRRTKGTWAAQDREEQNEWREGKEMSQKTETFEKEAEGTTIPCLGERPNARKTNQGKTAKQKPSGTEKRKKSARRAQHRQPIG